MVAIFPLDLSSVIDNVEIHDCNAMKFSIFFDKVLYYSAENQSHMLGLSCVACVVRVWCHLTVADINQMISVVLSRPMKFSK